MIITQVDVFHFKFINSGWDKFGLLCGFCCNFNFLWMNNYSATVLPWTTAKNTHYWDALPFFASFSFCVNSAPLGISKHLPALSLALLIIFVTNPDLPAPGRWNHVLQVFYLKRYSGSYVCKFLIYFLQLFICFGIVCSQSRNRFFTYSYCGL